MLSNSCISEKLEIDRKVRHFRTDEHRAILKVKILTSLSATGRLVPRHGAGASDEDESGGRRFRRGREWGKS
jgi:hypothetical protein